MIRSLLFITLWLLVIAAHSQRPDESGRMQAINPALVTTDPLENADKLYQFLRDTYRHKIISGVMTLGSMDEVNWLKANTGKEPAIVGLDFMHCGRGYGWYNDEEPVNDARTYYQKNGIPVFVWHWRDPSKKTEEFYTAKTTFDISKIFSPGTAEYDSMISDIDYVAGLLKILHDEGIPVIWRPLHEAAGGWFWWGAKGAGPCKRLFQVMFDRLVNHHGLKNLIWVWTREPNDDSWYPGDQYVDLIGRDIYKDGDHSSHIAEFNKLSSLNSNQKMVALTECGSMPDPDNLVKDKAGWLWFMPWYGKYTRETQYNSLTLWKKVMAHNYVITLDEMPDLQNYVPVVTNTEDPSGRTFFELFPTVVNENKLLLRASERIGRVTIYNALGIAVNDLLIDSDSASIAVSGGAGVYYLKRNYGTQTLKFVLR